MPSLSYFVRLRFLKQCNKYTGETVVSAAARLHHGDKALMPDMFNNAHSELEEAEAQWWLVCTTWISCLLSRYSIHRYNRYLATVSRESTLV